MPSRSVITDAPTPKVCANPISSSRRIGRRMGKLYEAPARLFSNPAEHRGSLPSRGDESYEEQTVGCRGGGRAGTCDHGGFAPMSWSAAAPCCRSGTSSRTQSIRRITRRSLRRSRRLAWSIPSRARGPFTVFAPVNAAAFGALPAGTVDTLLQPENKATLTKVS